jgi:hypothetical protein
VKITHYLYNTYLIETGSSKIAIATGNSRPRGVIGPDELNVRDQFRKSSFELHRGQRVSHTMSIAVLPQSVPRTTATCNVMRNGASSVMIANRNLAKAILHGTCHSR